MFGNARHTTHLGLWVCRVLTAIHTLEFLENFTIYFLLQLSRLVISFKIVKKILSDPTSLRQTARWISSVASSGGGSTLQDEGKGRKEQGRGQERGRRQERG